MKSVKKSLLIAVVSSSALCLCLSVQAQPVPAYTYSFTADESAGNTSFDGSTITINSATDTLIAWNLKGDDFAFDSSSPRFFISDPGSVTAQDITSATTAGFTGTFQVSGDNYLFDDFPFVDVYGVTFSGSDSSLDVSGTYESSFPFPFFLDIDPPGSWTYTGTQYLSAPDMASTFGLLLAGVAALEVMRRRTVLVPARLN